MYKAYNDKMENILPSIKSGSVDIILTDPPYLYLKNQKLDKQFDEELLFNEAKRILKKSGFIVLFGRGTSFYRWNTMLDDLDFQFKEEVIWNKRRISSPSLPLGRVHETISIHTKGSGRINRCNVNYEESKVYEPDKIIADIKRVESTLRQPDKYKHITDAIEQKSKLIPDLYGRIGKRKSRITYNSDTLNKDIGVYTLNSFVGGVIEKDIIDHFGDKYSAIHPTQKPVRLIERLLALVLPKDVERPIVLDPFSGSFSTGVASINMGCYPILIELDKEYYEKGVERIEKDAQQLQLF